MLTCESLDRDEHLSLGIYCPWVSVQGKIERGQAFDALALRRVVVVRDVRVTMNRQACQEACGSTLLTVSECVTGIGLE